MSGFSVSPADCPLRWFELPDEAAWADAAADEIAGQLAAISEAGPAHLLLSGGGTPAPVYRALARRALPWPRIRIGLVDERVSADPAASNALLLRETLLRDAAAAARLQPLHPVPGAADGGPEDAGGQAAADTARHDPVAQANARLAEAGARVVAVFGMGDDGHTASLFPGAAGLAAALGAEDPYVRVDASGVPGARGWPQRVSLTPAGWRDAAARILLLRGEDKRALFGRALQSGDAAELPVRALFAGRAPLTVYWCR